MERIGVFVCHCGRNIGSTVDIPRVVKAISELPGVAHCEDYKYMCSEPGQRLIKARASEKQLDRLVIACCSPSLHEETFRRLSESIGINRYLTEIANIREQCSWVHTEVDKATEKAIAIIRTIVAKTALNKEIQPGKIPLTRRVLVVGGGIAGIQAALDLGNSGIEVILVEREPSIGGHMAQLSETFPTLDCSQCILTPRMVEVSQHRMIRLMTYSEVEEVSGYVGNFRVVIRQKARSVDHSRCNGCGLCMERCPVRVGNEFECGLTERRAIYVPFAQAVPGKPVIDRASCLYFKAGKCGVCAKICPTEAIDYQQTDKLVEAQVGAIIIATGYELYPISKIAEYGSGKHLDVIDGLCFERLLSASGPTQGEIKRPSDGKIPQKVAFICCVGSRDPEHHLPYCSKICCMYSTKHALLYKEHVPKGEAVVFCIDVRTPSKDYEEFYARAKQEARVIYIRGKPSRIVRDGDGLSVWAVDTLTGKQLRLRCDMVVLSVAVVPSSSSRKLAEILRVPTNQYGFFSEAHPKLRPVESVVRGVFFAGCCQAPKDIPESVAQASAAASKVFELLSGESIQTEPMVAWVDENLCSGCKVCIESCPYKARTYDEEKKVALVNEALCQGCGACVVACSTGATQQKNLSDQQYLKMVEAVFGEDQGSS